MREGILKAGIWQRGSWLWLRDAKSKEVIDSIDYEVNTLAADPWLRLFYTLTKTGTDNLWVRILPKELETRPAPGYAGSGC